MSTFCGGEFKKNKEGKKVECIPAFLRTLGSLQFQRVINIRDYLESRHINYPTALFVSHRPTHNPWPC